MKLAIASFSTALVLATGASAMIGPYERAVTGATVDESLFTQGKQEVVAPKDTASPAYIWSDGQPRDVTVFSTKDEASRGHDDFEGR